MFANSILRLSAHHRKRFTVVFTLGLSVGLSFFLALAPLRPSLAVSVVDVPNPQQIDGTWVTDMADMLSDRTEVDLNQMIAALEATNGTEVAVVTVLDTQGAASPKAFATELFNTWGIGKEGSDNGVLFLISKGDRRNEIETGYGVESILPDAKLGAILDQQVTPQFKAGNFDAGVLSGTETMVVALGGTGLSTLPQTNVPKPAATPTQQPVTTPQPVSSGEATHVVPPVPSGAATSNNSKARQPLWMLLIGAVVPVVIVLKPLRRGKLPPIRLAPTGRTDISHTAGSWFYLWAKAWMGIGLSVKKIYNFKIFFNIENCKKATVVLAKSSSWLTVHHRNQQLNRTALVLFLLLFLVSIAALPLRGFNAFWVPIVTWGWLTTEFGICHFSHNKLPSETREKAYKSLFMITLCTLIVWSPFAFFVRVPSPLAFLMLLAAAIFFLIVIFRLQQKTGGILSKVGLAFLLLILPFCVLFFGNALFASPFLLTAVFGTMAGLVRLFRASHDMAPVTCESCDRPMQTLTSAQLINTHLTRPQLFEVKLGSKAYEGWCCTTCSPLASKTASLPSAASPKTSSQKQKSADLSIHLLSFVLDRQNFRNCKTCNALTLTVKSVVTQQATYSHSGRRVITKYCHCCKEHTRKTVTIPKKSSSSSSSSSSSRSSSSRSSSGSFGGGSSGGGGAGSSW